MGAGGTIRGLTEGQLELNYCTFCFVFLPFVFTSKPDGSIVAFGFGMKNVFGVVDRGFFETGSTAKSS